jgi:hypothetical protein
MCCLWAEFVLGLAGSEARSKWLLPEAGRGAQHERLSLDVLSVGLMCGFWAELLGSSWV